MTSATILLAVLAFEIKHFACDFILQTGYQAENKKIYGHVAGFIHAGNHAILSIPAYLILSASWPLIAALVVFEFVLHYHVDWTKGLVDTRMGWTFTDGPYWTVFGTDQFVHQLTYIGLTAYIAGLL